MDESDCPIADTQWYCILSKIRSLNAFRSFAAIDAEVGYGAVERLEKRNDVVPGSILPKHLVEQYLSRAGPWYIVARDSEAKLFVASDGKGYEFFHSLHFTGAVFEVAPRENKNNGNCVLSRSFDGKTLTPAVVDIQLPFGKIMSNGDYIASEAMQKLRKFFTTVSAEDLKNRLLKLHGGDKITWYQQEKETSSAIMYISGDEESIKRLPRWFKHLETVQPYTVVFMNAKYPPLPMEYVISYGVESGKDIYTSGEFSCTPGTFVVVRAPDFPLFGVTKVNKSGYFCVDISSKTQGAVFLSTTLVNATPFTTLNDAVTFRKLCLHVQRRCTSEALPGDQMLCIDGERRALLYIDRAIHEKPLFVFNDRSRTSDEIVSSVRMKSHPTKSLQQCTWKPGDKVDYVTKTPNERIVNGGVIELILSNAFVISGILVPISSIHKIIFSKKRALVL
jgi:hypothetical protein